MQIRQADKPNMKRLLVYSNVPLWEIHYSEAIEISLQEAGDGAEVHFFQCHGELPSCPANKNHDLNVCARCIKQSNYVIKNILGEKVKIFRLSEWRAGDQEVELNVRRHSDFFTVSHDGYPLASLVASDVANHDKDAFFDFSGQREKINEMYKNAVILYEKTLSYIESNKINEVAVWNGRRASDGPVNYAALKKGIKCYSFISSSSLGRFVKVDGPNVFTLDSHRFAVKGLRENVFKIDGLTEIMRKQGELFYRKQRYGDETVSLGTSNFSERHKNKVLVKKNRPLMVLFTSSVWEKFGVHDYRTDLYEDEYAGIKAILSDDDLLSKYDVVVRWHPNLTGCGRGEREWILAVEKITSKSVKHFLPEADVDSYYLLEQADVVVSFGSTLGVEACYYGKPSVVLGPCIYDVLNVACFPYSHKNFIDVMSQALPVGDKDEALLYGFYEMDRCSEPFVYLQEKGGRFFYNGKRLKLNPTLFERVRRKMRCFLPPK